MVKSISSKEVLKRLTDAGFEIVRQNGSHHILRHPDGRRTVVNHPLKDMRIGTLKSIEKDTNLELK